MRVRVWPVHSASYKGLGKQVIYILERVVRQGQEIIKHADSPSARVVELQIYTLSVTLRWHHAGMVGTLEGLSVKKPRCCYLK